MVLLPSTKSFSQILLCSESQNMFFILQKFQAIKCTCTFVYEVKSSLFRSCVVVRLLINKLVYTCMCVAVIFIYCRILLIQTCICTCAYMYVFLEISCSINNVHVNLLYTCMYYWNDCVYTYMYIIMYVCIFSSMLLHTYSFLCAINRFTSTYNV